MSEPWPQTTGFSSNTLSNPHRLMNTSGINFRDHAGSMVSFFSTSRLCFLSKHPPPPPFFSLNTLPSFHPMPDSIPTNQKQTTQDLCHAALIFASDTLKAGGHFVCKYYQGGEDKALYKKLQKMFEKVHREKPESSRAVRSDVPLVPC